MKAVISMLILLFLSTSCISETEDTRVETGTVKYITLEGGFYGITSRDNSNYDPINLSAEFRVDGLKISFKYKICNEQTSFHMWGTNIELLEVNKIN